MKKVKYHRDKYSKSAKFTDSSWKTDFIAMALKSVVKAVLNYAPKSIELAKQLAMDETVKTGIAPDMSEVPQEEFDITPPEKEKPKVDKKTGEVEDGMTKAEMKAVEEAVNKKEKGSGAEEFVSG